MTLGLAGAALAATAGAWAWGRIRLWRRKHPDEIERQRRLEVNRRGRIAVGHILDVVDSEVSPAPRRLVVFTYEVAGVTYEASQDVSGMPALASHAHGLAGRSASVKYDPQQPSNSIIACEDWYGVSLKERLGTGERSELVLPPAPGT